jgi:hypothetical protein
VPSRHQPFRLSKAVRAAIAILCAGLAAIHIFRPDKLPLDATSLGLIAAVIVFLFFDVKKVGWGPIQAAIADELTEADEQARRVPQTQAPAPELPKISPPDQTPPQTVILDTSTIVAGMPVETLKALGRLTQSSEDHLLDATEQIRVELLILAGNSGNLPDSRPWTGYDPNFLTSYLTLKDVLPAALIGPTIRALDAREDLIRGKLGSRVIALAARLSVDVLKKLREIKRNYVRVRETDVDLFDDQSMTSKFQNAIGIMLVTLNDSGQVVQPAQVFPRGEVAARGAFVSWEWDLSKVIRKTAWYPDPITKRPKVAWSESATFVGRR